MEKINKKDINDNNIIADINLILFNMPKNASYIEQIRWVYIKLGDLFIYDYRVANHPDIVTKELNFEEDYIGGFQTCIQIAEIMNIVINSLGPECKGKIVETSDNVRGIVGPKHRANAVEFSNGEKYLLDLTLDLYLIQSGCQTKHFGYTCPNGEYDIMPLVECESIDKKYGLIKFGEYTDKRINDLKSKLNNTDYSNMTEEEILNYKIMMLNTITPKFRGAHEGKMYLNKLFIEVLKSRFKEYHLTSQREKNEELATVFKFVDTDSWYLYTPNLGLFNSSKENIKSMLNSGWKSKSNSLFDDLENNKTL